MGNYLRWWRRWRVTRRRWTRWCSTPRRTWPSPAATIPLWGFGTLQTPPQLPCFVSTMVQSLGFHCMPLGITSSPHLLTSTGRSPTSGVFFCFLNFLFPKYYISGLADSSRRSLTQVLLWHSPVLNSTQMVSSLAQVGVGKICNNFWPFTLRNCWFSDQDLGLERAEQCGKLPRSHWSGCCSLLLREWWDKYGICSKIQSLTKNTTFFQSFFHLHPCSCKVTTSQRLLMTTVWSFGIWGSLRTSRPSSWMRATRYFSGPA